MDETCGVPFRYPRTVRWGDCDPAGMIYTPRVFDYALEAMEAFFRDVVGVTWYDLNWKQNMGSPTVRAECDFIRALRADQRIFVEVRVEKIGTSAITSILTALDEEGHHYFRAKVVECIIDNDTMKSVPIPAPYRERVIEYQKACGDE